MIFQPVVNQYIIFVLVGLGVIAASYFAFRSRASRRLMWAWIRRVIIVALMGVLLMRPSIGEVREVEVYSTQYDVFFVVDTTASMVAEDWTKEGSPRLTGVKKDIGRIVDVYSGSRFSLVEFDSCPRISTPLTRDSTSIMEDVNRLKPEITKYSKGSSIGAANRLADGVCGASQVDIGSVEASPTGTGEGFLADLLKRNAEAEPDRARLVFYFGDGEQTSTEPPESYETVAPYINGGKVYGYGTVEGGRMKNQNGIIISNKDDEYIMDTTQTPAGPALSKIDEEGLATVAEQLGVEYEIRSSEAPISIPEKSADDLQVTNQQGLKIVSDYSWAVALPLYMLLAFELSFVVLALTALMRREPKAGGKHG